MIERIVIFGATGDLTGRYLIPALAKLYEAGRLPSDIKVTGIDRKQWKNGKNGFRRLVLDSLERHAGGVSANALARMAVEVRVGDSVEEIEAGERHAFDLRDP